MAALAALLLVACHHGSDGGTGGDGAGGGGGTTGAVGGAGGTPADGGAGGDLGPVTGTDVDTFLTERGEVQRPDDPQRTHLSALVPGPGGKFTVLTAVQRPDGSFEIPLVPAGTYDLRLDFFDEAGRPDGSTIFVTSERHLDIGGLFGGRPDWQAAKDPKTTLTLDADGLSPWQPTDQIQLFSLGSSGFDVFGAANAGDTHLHATIDLVGRPFHLVDGGKGDTLLVMDMVSGLYDSMSVLAVRGAFSAAPYTHVDGMNAAISGTFTMPRPLTVSIDWRMSAFAALAADVTSEKPALVTHSLMVYAEPAGPGRASLAWPPTLLEAWVTDLMTPPMDRRLVALFGDPAPESWPLLVDYSTTFDVAPIEVAQQPRVGGVVPLADVAKGTVQPGITPPRALRVQPASTTPTISWEAPAGGQAAVYQVSLYQRADQPAFPPRADLWTQGLAVTVPPGLLVPGQPFVVKVAARTAYDAKAPFTRFPSVSYAESVSDTITP